MSTLFRRESVGSLKVRFEGNVILNGGGFFANDARTLERADLAARIAWAYFS
jgi:hypothetical protein